MLLVYNKSSQTIGTSKQESHETLGSRYLLLDASKDARLRVEMFNQGTQHSNSHEGERSRISTIDAVISFIRKEDDKPRGDDAVPILHDVHGGRADLRSLRAGSSGPTGRRSDWLRDRKLIDGCPVLMGLLSSPNT